MENLAACLLRPDLVALEVLQEEFEEIQERELVDLGLVLKKRGGELGLDGTVRRLLPLGERPPEKLAELLESESLARELVELFEDQRRKRDLVLDDEVLELLSLKVRVVENGEEVGELQVLLVVEAVSEEGQVLLPEDAEIQKFLLEEAEGERGVIDVVGVFVLAPQLDLLVEGLQGELVFVEVFSDSEDQLIAPLDALDGPDRRPDLRKKFRFCFFELLLLDLLYLGPVEGTVSRGRAV